MHSTFKIFHNESGFQSPQVRLFLELQKFLLESSLYEMRKKEGDRNFKI